LRKVEFSSHLFQRVASFLPGRYPVTVVTTANMFSSLSESGFIPTDLLHEVQNELETKVLISFREWLHSYTSHLQGGLWGSAWTFSSLSESGFIPTRSFNVGVLHNPAGVLISFREWLHSYLKFSETIVVTGFWSSHLFQRVASFLQCKTN